LASSWRLNVWEIGWNASPIELAARILSGPLAGGYCTKSTLPDGRVFWGIAQFYEIFGWIITGTIMPPGTRFPFGMDVEPDSPV
jgi:hypothetical protein